MRVYKTLFCLSNVPKIKIQMILHSTYMKQNTMPWIDVIKIIYAIKPIRNCKFRSSIYLFIYFVYLLVVQKHYSLNCIYITLIIKQLSRKIVIMRLKIYSQACQTFHMWDEKRFKGKYVDKIFEKEIDIKVKKRNDGFVFMSTLFLSKLWRFVVYFLFTVPPKLLFRQEPNTTLIKYIP